MTTGQLIKAARKKAGMTQAELADKLGIPYQSVSQWERGTRNPKRETLKRLAKALHVTIPYFDGMDDLNALDIDEALRARDTRTAEKLMGLHEGALDPPDPGYSHSDLERQLIFSFSNLNREGQKEAVKRVDELSELSRYRRPDAPHLLNIADIDVRAETAPQSPVATSCNEDPTPPPEGSEGPQEAE